MLVRLLDIFHFVVGMNVLVVEEEVRGEGLEVEGELEGYVGGGLGGPADKG